MLKLTMKASGAYEVPRIYLLEFDTRFGMFKEFIPYDFRTPLTLPGTLVLSSYHISC